MEDVYRATHRANSSHSTTSKESSSPQSKTKFDGSGIVFVVLLIGGICFLRNFCPEWLEDFLFDLDAAGFVAFYVVGVFVVIGLSFAAMFGWSKLVNNLRE